MNRFALLACDVFRKEIEFYSGDDPAWTTCHYLEMGLHDQPDTLRSIVQKTLTELEADLSIEAIAMAYGLCGNGLLGIRAGRVPLILPQAHDCITVLLGGKDRHDAVLKENPGMYFYSPGWIREKRVPGPDREAWLKQIYDEKFPDDPEQVEEILETDREMFLHHNCAAYVSILDDSDSRQYCQRCANHMDWEHRELPGEPGYLKALIGGDWSDTSRFLQVPPGFSVGNRADGQLCALPPSP